VHRYVMLVLLTAAPGLGQIAPTAAAQLTGVVADENGRPLPGAHVLYTRQVQLVKGADGKWRDAPGQSPLSSQTLSDSTGKYTVSQLPAGDYNLCISATGYLPTCEWSGWQRATLAASQAVDRGSIQLAKAVKVIIRLNDPQHLLRSANQVTAPIVVGAREKSGRFHPAREISTDSTGHTLQVEVPSATPLELSLHSWRYRLSDSGGTPVNNLDLQLSFQVPLNGFGPIYTFTIVGEVRK
jgi:hypothetical protein